MVSYPEDLTHRYSNTFIRVRQPMDKNYIPVYVSTFKYKEGVPAETQDIKDLILYGVSEGKNRSFDCGACKVDLKSPGSRYIQFSNQALYISKTGERHFKKGFTLDAVNEGRRMYCVLNPVLARLNMIESLNEDILFPDRETLKLWRTRSPALNDDRIPDVSDVATQIFNPIYIGLKDACAMIDAGAFSVALSKTLAIAASSNSKYKFELYSEMFPFGYYDSEKKLFTIQQQYKQDIQDYVTYENRTEESYAYSFLE